MDQKIFVNFVIKTDEAIRFECRRAANIAVKEIFCVKEKFFFFYVMNRFQGINTVSLREITSEEYNARKAELLSCRPDAETREWTVDGNFYALKTFFFGTWKRNMAAQDCIFITEDNPIRELAESVIAEVSHRREAEETLDKASKTEYAKKCGGLAHRLGISFVNVLRIGPDKNKLMKFKNSYQRALIKAQALSLKEQRRLYDLLNNGRKARKEALELLEIQYFDVDVNLLDFTELIQNLWTVLSEYSAESVKQAIRVGSEMSYEEREDIFKMLSHNSRELKRNGLARLGIEVEAIEFKRYPIVRIRSALAATLGIELDTN